MKAIRVVSAHIAAGTVIALLSADVAFAQQGLRNPLEGGGISTIPQFISSALKVMVMVALPIITLFLVYSGFLFVLTQGNQEQLSQAKTNFVYVVIGAILILGAWVFASILGGTISQLTNGA